MTELREFTILGVHHVKPTPAELTEALAVLWGDDLPGAEREEAMRKVREHFERLYLFEVRVAPADADVDWALVNQPDPDQPESDWQVPYDEQAVEPDDGRWAFFLHFVDLTKPLMTPVGLRPLPAPTPRPDRLAHVQYQLP